MATLTTEYKSTPCSSEQASLTTSHLSPRPHYIFYTPWASLYLTCPQQPDFDACLSHLFRRLDQQVSSTGEKVVVVEGEVAAAEVGEVVAEAAAEALRVAAVAVVKAAV